MSQPFQSLFLITCPFLLFFAGSFVSAGKAQEKKTERPSQAAVLGKNTMAKLNIPFGENEKQRLDAYLPKEANHVPVLLFIHGGEWTKGDKDAVSFKPKFLNENNIAFISVNYRLSPEHKHPAHVQDVAAALRWVKDHAGELKIAPDKIFLMGHSAGCHLASLVALDPRYLKEVGMAPKDLRGVIAWSGGMYDLVDRAKGTGMYPKYIRQTFGETETEWRNASPAAHVGEGYLPPFLFAYIERKTEGQEKRVEPSLMMARRIRDAKGSAEVHFLPDRTHFEANHLLGAPGDEMGKILLDFIQKSCK